MAFVITKAKQMSQTQLKTLSNIKNFLEEISVSDQGKDVEKNIFSIGAKGYYENPTSDMLAFFVIQMKFMD